LNSQSPAFVAPPRMNDARAQIADTANHMVIMAARLG